MHRLLSALVLASTLAASACTVTSAPPRRTYVVTEAPPEPRADDPSGDRPGKVWVRGRWEFVDNNWVWRDGRWIREKNNHVWVQGRWVKAGGQWQWHAGHWERRASRRARH
jgi:hypothetical protein